jgi:hypothetical protein
MENYFLNAHNLEWLRFFVASQTPLASFDEHIIVSMTIEKATFIRKNKQ